MALDNIGSLEILLSFEPVVKLLCENFNCRFNLTNAANTPERREAACNLKQITIGHKGQCKNFEQFIEKGENDTRS